MVEEIRRFQDVDESHLVERIKDNKFQILDLQKKLKESEKENSHYSQMMHSSSHQHVPSYFSYKS